MVWSQLIGGKGKLETLYGYFGGWRMICKVGSFSTSHADVAAWVVMVPDAEAGKFVIALVSGSAIESVFLQGNECDLDHILSSFPSSFCYYSIDAIRDNPVVPREFNGKMAIEPELLADGSVRLKARALIGPVPLGSGSVVFKVRGDRVEVSVEAVLPGGDLCWCSVQVARRA